jgi:hypothetical protein
MNGALVVGIGVGDESFQSVLLGRHALVALSLQLHDGLESKVAQLGHANQEISVQAIAKRANWLEEVGHVFKGSDVERLGILGKLLALRIGAISTETPS